VESDVVVVGGGISGSALAAALARGGLEVVVLERQREYRDRVRGETLWPWGVAEAMTLGLHEPVLEAAGGAHVETLVDYRDGDDPDGAEREPIPLSLLVDGVPGALNAPHPAACAAFARAAVRSGAVGVRGVEHVRVAPGPRPEVRYSVDGGAERIRCRLVVGADGRASRVRRQSGIPLEQGPVPHMIAGLLVDGLEADPGRDVAAVADDVFMVVLPQGARRARVYLCFAAANAGRFAGRNGADEFIRTCARSGVPDPEMWTKATPAGPCRTYPADDTWTDRPFVDGVVLIGDAAGYNNPLIGQGLALALRDVRALSELLLDRRPWNAATFARYGRERAERLRRMRFIAHLQATELTTFGPAGRALRGGVERRLSEDPSLLAGPLAMFTGPDELDPEVATDPFRARYFGIDC
jgi:menaquinone-9 beta-reductase